MESYLTALGALVALTNLAVAVIKRVTWKRLPTNALVCVVAEALTLCAGTACYQMRGLSLVWYDLAGMAVTGCLVAYAAMFGFDKCKEVLAWMQRPAA